MIGPEGDQLPPRYGDGPGRLFQDWGRLEKTDPELSKLLRQERELAHQTRDLVEDYRQASGPEKDEIKANVKKSVTEHFEVRQQLRQRHLKRLEEGLKRLQEAIDRRNKAREQIVNRRVTELLGQEEDAGF